VRGLGRDLLGDDRAQQRLEGVGGGPGIEPAGADTLHERVHLRIDPGEVPSRPPDVQGHLHEFLHDVLAASDPANLSLAGPSQPCHKLTPSPMSASTIVAAIGQTPLVRLSRLERDVPGLELYGKLEASNPGGSVKDRAARHMILEGLRTGALGPGKRLLDATSGNTGIAYAMLGAALGFPVTLCLPSSASPERKRILTAYGAELVFTDPMDGSDGAIVEARRRYAEDSDRYFYPDQYNNDFNWRAHFETTGPEILKDTAGRITHFVAALGTSGTFMGTGRFLRANVPNVVLISVQPESPLHGLEGLKHMATAIVPGIYDATLADYAAEVSTEDAHEMTRRLAREEGLLVGVSSGANLAAAVARAAEARQTRDHIVMVCILCDAGDRYLSEHFWDETREQAR
jgi:cysteine synthase B